MKEYKEKWSQSRGGKSWEYQEAEVEQNYRTFIEERKGSDKYLQQLILEEVTMVKM